MTNEEIAVELKDHENQIKSLKHRMNNVEESYKALSELATSVKVLAVNMKHMADEQTKQGERLERLEQEPAEEHKNNKRTIINCIITGIISAAISAIMTFIISGGLS